MSNIAIRIPFKNKGELLNINKGIDKFSGIAYYILNSDGIIIRQIIQLDLNTVYRMNDLPMMKTSYWKSFQGDRVKIFSKTNTSNTRERYDLSNTQLKEINIIFWKKFKKFKKQIDFITGSNYSGAKQDISADRALTLIDGMPYRFSNFLNKLSDKGINNKILWEGNLTNLKMITLKEYIDKYEFAAIEFAKYNADLISEESNYYKYIDFNKFVKQFKNSKFEQSAYLYISRFAEGEICIKRLKSALRSVQKTYLKLEAILNNYSIDFLGEKSDIARTHVAHIIPVSESVNTKKYFEIADPDNGLLLTPTNHDLYDNGGYNFIVKENGVVSFQKNMIILGNLDIKCLNDKRKKYIIRSNK